MLPRLTELFCLAMPLIFSLLAVTPVLACSRILWNDNGFSVVSSRTMDWPESTEPTLVVFPQGISHNGGKLAGMDVVAENPAIWKSKYGSIVTTVYGIGTVDGLNEEGFAVHALYLTATNYGPRDPKLPGVHAGLWAQYLLDNAKNVEEALQLAHEIQVVMVEAHGREASLHLAMEDASGDSAIIEYIDGKPVVHHGKQYQVMTNDPTYDEQLTLLSKLDFSKPSSDMPLPGNVNARDRFQRASYYLNLLPSPKDERQAVANVLAIARNVSVPFGAPYKNFGVYNTEYRTAIDLTNRRYFFELTTSPNVIWVNLNKMDLSPGASVLELNPYDYSLSGNVDDKFQKLNAAPF
ncbi:linear amide C-N hydrolase [Blastopirellula marina]|uniref:Choloylglycine hydrolase n=1 Tax=Blastopirellula marina TaxID=124 RepID=A0A2S8G2H3_9BACT|nr:linear amide C-N hydrolase [Blastopirellula marina]PQO38623.1 choloylglycine hydrolase [Blastopirellula marina]PTL45280.1 linear amide C-N hydrolase [Blastopirellula marina]